MNKKFGRKFIMAVLGFVVGVLTTFLNHSSEIVQLAGVALAGVSAITYIISESRLDMKSIKVTIQSIADAKALLESMGVDMSCLDPILRAGIENLEKGNATLNDLTQFIEEANKKKEEAAPSESNDTSEK